MSDSNETQFRCWRAMSLFEDGEELQRRNYSAGTIRSYLDHVAAFAQHSYRLSDQPRAEDIGQYQLFLIQHNKLVFEL